MLDVPAHGRWRGCELGLARRIELEVGRVDDDVRAGELAELTDLNRRPGCLHGAAAPDHEDLADPGLVDRLDRRVRCVRRCELVGREREHPCDVERDVSVPDHDRPLRGQVERELLIVRVTVVPGDELGCGPRAGQVLTRNSEPAIGLRADGVDDGAVELCELVVQHILADLDVPEETKAGQDRGLLERSRDRFDVGMVGRDPEPDEPPGRRQPLDHVDLDLEVAREQRGGRVEARGPGADHGDPKTHGATLEGVAQCEQPEPQPPASWPDAASSDAPSSTVKEWPQPHEALAFGLSILKPDSVRPVRKSIVAPCR